MNSRKNLNNHKISKTKGGIFMSDKDLKEFLIKSKEISRQSRQEFDKAIYRMTKAQKNIRDAI